MWAYDPPTGTWQDDALSAQLLRTAEEAAGKTARIVAASRGARGVEFGRAFLDFDDPQTQAALVKVMQSILHRTTDFLVLPHLRRTDDSYWRCECGAELAPPSDYGRKAHLMAEHASHPKVWTCRLGQTVAVYAIGMGQAAPGDLLVLREAEPIPIDV